MTSVRYANTLNICLGHLPFPEPYWDYADLMVSPKLIRGHHRLALVPDNLYGFHGSALSEYAQLFWILEHLAPLLRDRDHIRIFHYRRFVCDDAPTCGKKSSNLSWATTITADELGQFESAFDRNTDIEIFNTPVRFEGGMLEQYQNAHVLEDLFRFGIFLAEADILDRSAVVRFMRSETQIPSCNIGVFRADTFQAVFSVLRQAARFLDSGLFVPRTEYQRRNAGFLLERLNSHLLFERFNQGQSQPYFGHNIVISDSEVVTHTV